MISAPNSFLDEFAEAADSVLVHLEGTPHLHRALQRIKELGKRVGVATNPASRGCAGGNNARCRAGLGDDC
jgi:ribulose-phosphate 3-epimerase